MAGKALDRLENQLRDQGNARDAKRLDIIRVENALKGFQVRMHNPDLASAPPELVDELIKTDPSAAGLFARIQKAVLDLDDARKLAANTSVLQEYVDRKVDADRALADYKKQHRPQIAARYREKVLAESSGDDEEWRRFDRAFQHDHRLGHRRPADAQPGRQSLPDLQWRDL